MQAGVEGLGGAFIYSAQPEKLVEWYTQHLGINFQHYGGSSFGTNFVYRRLDEAGSKTASVFCIMPLKDRTHGSNYMINLRVFELRTLAARMKDAGVDITEPTFYEGQGWFAHVIDADGNKVELWEDHFDHSED